MVLLRTLNYSRLLQTRFHNNRNSDRTLEAPEIQDVSPKAKPVTPLRIHGVIALDNPFTPFFVHDGFGASNKSMFKEYILALFLVLGKTPHDETPHWGDPETSSATQVKLSCFPRSVAGRSGDGSSVMGGLPPPW